MKRRQKYAACSIDALRGVLRLRFRIVDEHGVTVQGSRTTGYADTPENRGRLEALRDAVGQLVRAGRDPRPQLDELLQRSTKATPPAAEAPVAGSVAAADPRSPTLATYFPEWIAAREPLERKANARDYKRHFRLYILPSAVGSIPLLELQPQDIRGLQGEIVSRVSVKTAKNVIGSLRAVLETAIEDNFVDRDVLPRFKWPDHETPEPDPFTADERAHILEWFRTKLFGFPQVKGSFEKPKRPHPPFYAYVHLLFWTGMRPSEASGLRWGAVDLASGRLYVRTSYHMGTFNKAPKTKQARRTVVLYPATVELLRSIQPLKHEPTTPVFTATTGAPIEPKTFSAHWYDCLRALGIRQRGLYSTKDTYATAALKAGVRIERLEAQTGVAYATLRTHYAKWVLDDAEQDELRVLAEVADPALLSPSLPVIKRRKRGR